MPTPSATTTDLKRIWLEPDCGQEYERNWADHDLGPCEECGLPCVAYVIDDTCSRLDEPDANWTPITAEELADTLAEELAASIERERKAKEPEEIIRKLAEVQDRLTECVRGHSKIVADCVRETARANQLERELAAERNDQSVNWDELTCVHGCDPSRNPVVGIYRLDQGCAVHKDKLQALCLQHLVSADDGANGDLVKIADRLESSCT